MNMWKKARGKLRMMMVQRRIENMPEKEFKNQKIREDIQNEFDSLEAKLALGILRVVEKSDGNFNIGEVEKLADACFKEMERN